MVNKPGTLLMVRKICRSRRRPGVFGGQGGIHEKIGIFYRFYLDLPENQRSSSAVGEPVNLPYGAAVMLIDLQELKKEGELATRNLVRLTLLYKEQRIAGLLTKKEAQKWFCVAKAWPRHVENVRSAKESRDKKLKKSRG